MTLTTTKTLIDGIIANIGTGSNYQSNLTYDFIVKVDAGHSVTAQTSTAITAFTGISRQIADIQGNLVQP